MARQTAVKNVETVETVETENTTAKNTGTSAEKYSPAQLKGMATTLKATEKAIEDEFGNITHSEYAIGKALTQIREGDLYLAAKEPAKNFSTYLDGKASEWRTTRMSLYNFMNLSSVSEKQVAKLGKTVASKIGSLKTIDPKAAEKVQDKANAMIDSGKTRKEALATVVQLSDKVREKAGVSRSPGRAKAAEEKAQADMAEVKAEKAAPADEISDQDRHVADWKDLPADKATKNAYTRIAIVEVVGYRLEIRSSAAVVDVKVIAQAPAKKNGK
jgi:hypothetical protein